MFDMQKLNGKMSQENILFGIVAILVVLESLFGPTTEQEMESLIII